jgi:hypothetical protein
MDANKNYKIVSLTTAINLIREQKLTDKMIGSIIGVTKLQVFYYSNGTTKSPAPKICKAIFDNFTINGEHLLVDLYDTYEELLQHYERVEVYNGKQNK